MFYKYQLAKWCSSLDGSLNGPMPSHFGSGSATSTAMFSVPYCCLHPSLFAARFKLCKLSFV